MPQAHRVESGDWIGAIAKRYGFEHWARIWDDPANEALRTLRSTPDLLMVGDMLQIPDPGPVGVELRTGQRGVFVLEPASDTLRIRLAGIQGFIDAFGPIAYVLQAGDERSEGSLTEEGQMMEVVLPYGATKALLTLMGKTYEYPVGGLGPASEKRGAHGRLRSLGFVFEKQPGGESGDDAPVQVVDPLSAGLARFQRSVGLPVTAELDEATQRALIDAYGC